MMINDDWQSVKQKLILLTTYFTYNLLRIMNSHMTCFQPVKPPVDSRLLRGFASAGAKWCWMMLDIHPQYMDIWTSSIIHPHYWKNIIGILEMCSEVFTHPQYWTSRVFLGQLDLTSLFTCYPLSAVGNQDDHPTKMIFFDGGSSVSTWRVTTNYGDKLVIPPTLWS